LSLVHSLTQEAKGTRDFTLVTSDQPISGAHQASKDMSTGGISHGVKLFNRKANHLPYLVPRLRVHAVIPPFLSTP
jgi:hypothetical protein